MQSWECTRTYVQTAMASVDSNIKNKNKTCGVKCNNTNGKLVTEIGYVKLPNQLSTSDMVTVFCKRELTVLPVMENTDDILDTWGIYI